MSFLHIGIAQVVEILPQMRQGPSQTRAYIFYTVNIMAADVLAT